jgi:two-component system, chemotaxis family, protein-glutamate methylesterase/glutaminase
MDGRPQVANNPKSVIAIGGSAGSIQVLQHLIANLPPDLPAIVLVEVHRPHRLRSYLPEILRRRSRMKVVQLFDSESLEYCVAYLSSPSKHLTINREGDHARLLPDPQQLRRAKSIDELFVSVAACAGNSAIGVLLSGVLNDGSVGLKAIKDAGGIVIVQDPADAKFGDMPENALRTVQADYVVCHQDIPEILDRLTRRGRPGIGPIVRKQPVHDSRRNTSFPRTSRRSA